MRIIIGFLVGAGIGAILFIIKEELINTYRYKRLKGKWKIEEDSVPLCFKCIKCMYFRITTIPFIGKGTCTNPKSAFCYKGVWDDDICDNFTADMRGKE